MIEKVISDYFIAHDWKWHLKGGKDIVPTEQDVEDALDEAAKMLYNGEPGDQLEVGRLIVVKKHTGHDVYIYVDEYL